MFEIMFEIFSEVIILLILSFPGAFIRWVFYKGKKSYKELLVEDYSNVNSTVSLVFIGLILVIFQFF